MGPGGNHSLVAFPSLSLVAFSRQLTSSLPVRSHGRAIFNKLSLAVAYFKTVAESVISECSQNFFVEDMEDMEEKPRNPHRPRKNLVLFRTRHATSTCARKDFFSTASNMGKV